MHPFLNILIYISIVLTMGLLPQWLFWGLCITVFLIALWLDAQGFALRLKKIKWMCLSILFVYAFATPGEYFFNETIQYLPTKEGVILGLGQALKLMVAISSLSILFYKKDVQTLIQGFIILLFPLKLLNINVNNISVRMLLTLQYVNQMTQIKFKDRHFSEIYDAIQTMPTTHIKNIHLPSQVFSKLDFFILSLIIIYLCLIFK